MSDQPPLPQPPFPCLPGRWQDTAYEQLPRGLQRRVDRWLASQDPTGS